MYAIWTKKEKPELIEIQPECLEKECRAIGSLLLHEQDPEERDDLESRYLRVNELRTQALKGYKVYLQTQGDVLLEPTDGGVIDLEFNTWICDDLIPS